MQRHDTLFNSARLNSVFAFPLSGRAPFMLRWSDFENDYFAQMERTGVVKSMKDFYWDIRPKPEYGTIELRVCDTPLTVDRAAALACYLQALCRYLLERQRERARRRATTSSTTTTASRPAASAWTASSCIPRATRRCRCARTSSPLCARSSRQAEDCRATAALEHVYETVKSGSDATFLRDAFDRSGSPEGMVDAAIRVFRKGGSPPPR